MGYTLVVDDEPEIAQLIALTLSGIHIPTRIAYDGKEAMDFIQQELPKIYSWELVELLFRQPYCRIGNLVDADIAKRQTASVYLKQLCDLGVLKEVKSGRENLFVHPKYIELLTGEENVWIYYADTTGHEVDDLPE